MKKEKDQDFNLKQQNQVNSIFLEFLITNLFSGNQNFSTITNFLPELTKSSYYEIDGIFQFTKSIEIESFKNSLMDIFLHKDIKAEIMGENSSEPQIKEGDFLVFETKMNSYNIQDEIMNYDKLPKIQKKINNLKTKKKLIKNKSSELEKPNFFLIFFYNRNKKNYNNLNNSKNLTNFDFLKKIQIGSVNTLVIFTDCKNLMRQTLKIEKVSVKTIVGLADKVDNLENQIEKLNTKFERLNFGFEKIMNEFDKKSKEKEKEIEDLKEINDMQEKIIFNYKTINKSVSETYKMIEDVNSKNKMLTEENLKLRKVCELNTISKRFNKKLFLFILFIIR